jgi:hypothetical protein
LLTSAYNRKVDPKTAFELGIANPFQQDLSLGRSIQNILDEIQELAAHSGTTSCMMRLPMRFLDWS